MPKTNIQFNYLYRDAGNFKAFGNEVFSNTDKLSIGAIDQRIRAALIDEQFFNPLEWGIKRLEIAEWDDELDHDWHAFVSVEPTTKPATRSIEQLFKRITWSTQSPRDGYTMQEYFS